MQLWRPRDRSHGPAALGTSEALEDLEALEWDRKFSRNGRFLLINGASIYNSTRCTLSEYEVSWLLKCVYIFPTFYDILNRGCVFTMVSDTQVTIIVHGMCVIHNLITGGPTLKVMREFLNHPFIDAVLCYKPVSCWGTPMTMETYNLEDLLSYY